MRYRIDGAVVDVLDEPVTVGTATLALDRSASNEDRHIFEKLTGADPLLRCTDENQPLTVRLEPYRGAVTWTSEQSARLMATETLAAVSDLRIVAL